MVQFIVKVNVKSLSRFQLFATPWTAAHQAPPSMGFSRQEYWSGVPFPSPGDLPNPGIKPRSPAFQADAFTSELPGKPDSVYKSENITEKKLSIVKKARSYRTKNGRWQLGVLDYGSEQVGALSQAATQKVYITATHEGKFHAQPIPPSSVSTHRQHSTRESRFQSGIPGWHHHECRDVSWTLAMNESSCIYSFKHHCRLVNILH